MRVSFENAKLRKLCNQRREAVRELGHNSAKMLEKRMRQIKDVANVAKLTEGKPHQLTRDRAGEYAVSLAGGDRLVFAPDHDPVPAGKGGGIDWSAVTSIRITFIGNYHG